MRALSAIISKLMILVAMPAVASAEVVINEIFHHAPADLDELEFVELYNPGEDEVDLSGWKFTAGIKYEFPAGARLAAGEFLVLARKKELLTEFYDVKAFGQYDRSLNNGGETLTLSDREGRVVESVPYRDRRPWPVAADGYSASIERICPSAPSDSPLNWAPSTLSDDYESTPSGTPGKPNSGHAPSLPPVISSLQVSPSFGKPGEPIRVEAFVTGRSPLESVRLLYRVCEPGRAGDEKSLPMEKRAGGSYTATIPGQPAQRIVRLRVRATDEAGVTRIHPHPNEIRPARSVYVSGDVEIGKIPGGHIFNIGEEEYRRAAEYREDQNRERGRDRGRFGGFGRGRRGRGRFGDSRSDEPLRPQGRSAFIYTVPGAREPEFFDFVNITRRKSGYKVRLHKDRPLNGITILNLVFERVERSVLTEALAYDLYRLAGNPAPRAEYIRVSIDGHPVGYHLAFEQPNKAFLRHNEIDPGGNLYKIIWQGTHRPSPRTPEEEWPERMDIVSRHEKKTNPHEGYEDLVELIEGLEETRGEEELWKYIQERFDVEQVINYFAVNMLLSHWDGFFNNYFLYHDSGDTERWILIPWDQDSTWGHRMVRGGDSVYYEMPLTFGMEGDVPPGVDPDDLDRREGERRGRRRRRGGFGGFGGFRRSGAWWWRPGGEISRPLLANPEFRRRFLARLKTLAGEVYTLEVFGPRFERLRIELEPEVKLRARLRGEDGEEAVQELHETIAFFREHLVKRRKWLLEEIAESGAGAPSPTPK